MGRVFQRSRRVYYTPAQVSVYLNGYLVDDACRISYDVADNWMPLFGHQDRLFRTLGMGQTIVVGELSVLFRYHGYLRRVISAVQNSASKLAQSQEEIAAMRTGQTAQALDDQALQQTAADVLRNFLDAAAENGSASYDKAASFLKDRFWGEAGPAQSRDITMAEIHGAANAESQANRNERLEYQNYMRPSTTRARNLQLRIVHGVEANIEKRAYVEAINQIQFRGKSYQADITVPNGERICTETYPFIAREITPI